MPFELDAVLQSVSSQAPMVGASLWIAQQFMRRHQDVVQKLVDTFENNNKLCEERSKQMFDELMKLKDRVEGKQ